jgi:hypothetical protein
MSQASEQIARQFAYANLNKETWGSLIYNVRENGAKGDGVTDSTSGINKTIDESVPTGGGVIGFPPGDYIVSGPIDLTKISTASSNGNKGLIFQGSGSNVTRIIFVGNGRLFNGLGNSSMRPFAIFEKIEVVTDTYMQSGTYKPGTIAFDLTYNQRFCHFHDVNIYGFDYGIKMVDNWIMEMHRVNTDKCNYGFYFEKDCNSINIYGGEHKGANTASIYVGDGEVVNLYGVTVETSDTVAGEGHGILIDSVKYMTIQGLYSEHMKGHVLYKRGTDPDANLFRSITLIGGMYFNFNPPVADIMFERPPGSAGNLKMTNANFNRCDLGTDPTTGGYADWAFDDFCTTTSPFKTLYVNDLPLNYMRRFEVALSNPLFDRATIRNPNGYDLLTLAMNAPLTYDAINSKWVSSVFNQPFISGRREDAKNKFPNYLSWTKPASSVMTTNGRKLTITANGTDMVATSAHIGGEFTSQILKPSTIYTLSGIATGAASGVVMRLTFYDKGKVNIGTQDFTGTTVTFTTPATVDYGIASFIVPATVASGSFSFEDLQLEQQMDGGSTATAYTPYHVDAFQLVVTPEGDEVRGLVGGFNINDWKADGSGGNKVFYASNSLGAFGAVNHFYSPRYRHLPVVDSEITKTNVGYVSDTDKIWKFRDQYGITYPVEMTRVLSKGARNLASNLNNAHVGMMVYCTSLQKPVWMKQVSPVIWVDATGTDVTNLP